MLIISLNSKYFILKRCVEVCIHLKPENIDAKILNFLPLSYKDKIWKILNYFNK